MVNGTGQVLAQKTFKSVLAERKPAIWAEIDHYLKHSRDVAKIHLFNERYAPEEQYHWAVTREYPERQGKYIRPVLLMIMAEALGVPREKAVRTSAAMQVSEDWILGHDDWQDNSEERRGKPALHRLYPSEIAINAGDTLHAVMWKILRDNADLVGHGKTFKLMDEFHAILMRTCFGQTCEMKWIKEGKSDFTDEDVFFIMDGKTVYYTIAGPLRLGAILGGATKEQVDSIFHFARPLGLCFQIRDDVLDITSDFEGLKKQFCNDIYEGKKTVMLGHLMRSANAADTKRLNEIMAKTREQKSREEVKWVLDKMKEYGSIEYATKLAEKFAAEARHALDTKLTWVPEGEAKDDLRLAVDFILTRTH
ncbi:MAG: polyprenyl synthetase family protein [Candidatus Aenigmatarchaeota archaeon]|nr:MAG: polyprenyl synthetase family protein [Candidatus Aenigmarchaeota archaeon]